jgi:CubicO group peptidase (beta-lactamase class C family)
MKRIITAFFGFFAIVLFLLHGCSGDRHDYGFPHQWKVSAPEEQGIDSEKLVEMFETILKEKKDVHSILILRRGFLVTEGYFNPYHSNVRHIIFSATKSISSLLIGIALEEGYIKDVGQPVLNFFPGYRDNVENPDERKKGLSLFHLLTMTDGLDWQDGPYLVKKKGDFLKLLTAADGIKYFLDKPMREDPGKKFNYSSGSSYMLAAIIQKTTGKSALEYAQEKLFNPLGIQDACWGIYQQGINNGGSELFLKPRDLAKIGCLVLNKGFWHGKQIVPTQWIKDSTREYVKTDFLQYRYGYQWYIDTSLPELSISAQGLGGQYLFIIPSLDMVVVFTGGLVERTIDAIDLPFYHLRDFILPAVKSVNPLPVNHKSNQKLQRLLREIEFPRPKTCPPLPSIVRVISGKTFFFDTKDKKGNLWGLESLSLLFNEKDACRIQFNFTGEVDFLSLGFDAVFRTSPQSQKKIKFLEAVAGLDGVFRSSMADTEMGEIPYFAKGNWTDEKTFIMKVNSGWCLPENHIFTFIDEKKLTYSCETIFYRFSLTGTVQ